MSEKVKSPPASPLYSVIINSHNNSAVSQVVSCGTLMFGATICCQGLDSPLSSHQQAVEIGPRFRCGVTESPGGTTRTGQMAAQPRRILGDTFALSQSAGAKTQNRFEGGKV